MRATCAFRPRALRGFCSASAPPVLGPKAVLALRALGIKAIEPSGAALFDAQRACWPLLDAGMPTFVAAPTGTGKSVLAVLRACTVAGTREEGAASIHAVADLALPRALVIAPTRELAAQHVDCARLMLEQVAPGARVALIAGGEKHAVQRRTLASTSPALVIGTPGRILAHVAQNHLSLHRVRCAHVPSPAMPSSALWKALGALRTRCARYGMPLSSRVRRARCHRCVVLDEADSLLSPDGGFWLEVRRRLHVDCRCCTTPARPLPCAPDHCGEKPVARLQGERAVPCRGLAKRLTRLPSGASLAAIGRCCTPSPPCPAALGRSCASCCSCCSPRLQGARTRRTRRRAPQRSPPRSRRAGAERRRAEVR